jgi:hypothetical protein
LDVRWCSRGFRKIWIEKPYNLYFSPNFVQAIKEDGIDITYNTHGDTGIHTFWNNIKIFVCTGLIWLRIKPSGHIFCKKQ